MKHRSRLSYTLRTLFGRGLVVFAAVLVLSAAAGFVFMGKYGFAAPAVVLGYLWYLRRGFRSLDGMSGDISGYALTFGELCGIDAFGNCH